MDDKRDETPRPRIVSKAPAPITPVSGWTYSDSTLDEMPKMVEDFTFRLDKAGRSKDEIARLSYTYREHLLKDSDYRHNELAAFKQRREDELDRACAELAGIVEQNQTDPARSPKEPTLASSRQGFVQPILAKKGWSILDLAKEAKVDHHTVRDYLNGKNKSFKSTRQKLAKAMGVDVDSLPD